MHSQTISSNCIKSIIKAYLSQVVRSPGRVGHEKNESKTNFLPSSLNNPSQQLSTSQQFQYVILLSTTWGYFSEEKKTQYKCDFSRLIFVTWKGSCPFFP
nr:hypothetical protein Q903MT_gene3385 [Picea sitchensis]